MKCAEFFTDVNWWFATGSLPNFQFGLQSENQDSRGSIASLFSHLFQKHANLAKLKILLELSFCLKSHSAQAGCKTKQWSVCPLLPPLTGFKEREEWQLLEWIHRGHLWPLPHFAEKYEC